MTKVQNAVSFSPPSLPKPPPLISTLATSPPPQPDGTTIHTPFGLPSSTPPTPIHPVIRRSLPRFRFAKCSLATRLARRPFVRYEQLSVLMTYLFSFVDHVSSSRITFCSNVYQISPPLSSRFVRTLLQPLALSSLPRPNRHSPRPSICNHCHSITWV